MCQFLRCFGQSWPAWAGLGSFLSPGERTGGSSSLRSAQAFLGKCSSLSALGQAALVQGISFPLCNLLVLHPEPALAEVRQSCLQWH